MPYLEGLDEFGNTALQPGGALSSDPISQLPQAAKYRLSELGLRYSFWQSVTMVNMSDVASGSGDLEYYTATFVGKWALTAQTNSGTASWLSTEANVQLGRLKRRFRVKNAIFYGLIKHNTATTRTSTFTAPLLTFLLTVRANDLSRYPRLKGKWRGGSLAFRLMSFAPGP